MRLERVVLMPTEPLDPKEYLSNSCLDKGITQKATYLAPIPTATLDPKEYPKVPPAFLKTGRHFVGFSRFSYATPDLSNPIFHRDSLVNKHEWNDIVDKMFYTTFPTVLKKIKALNLDRLPSNHLEGLVVWAINNKTEVGFCLCKIPEIADDEISDFFIDQVKKINNFVFTQISEFSNDPAHNVYLKLYEEGVLDAKNPLTLRDFGKLAVYKFPNDSIKHLPKTIQGELELLRFLA